ncbi:MAG: alpha/beta hydrolase [Saprospiraceae bacterium]
MKKVVLGIVIVIGFLTVLYYSGPRPMTPSLKVKLNEVGRSDINMLEEQINYHELKTIGIRLDNQARIVWADSSKKRKTPFAVVYLHGFSGSQFEAAPLHTEFAHRYGCNLFLARLESHGIETDNNLLDVTPDKMLASARDAVNIGLQLGEKVILMSTSTGSTLSLIIAAQNPELHSLIMYSPNIAIAKPEAALMDKPWGLNILRWVHKGDNFHQFDQKDIDEYTIKYWTWRYRIEALVALESLISNGMIEENFKNVKCPVFVGCYYKDEDNQDKVVSVEAMEEMFLALGTPEDQKRMIKFPEVKAHVIACKQRSKTYEEVQKETFAFAEQILKLPVVNP